MTTTLPLTDMPVPIVARPEGGYRVAGTRVSLESALAAYLRGPRTAAAIHEAFPAVDLPTAAALIAYYALHEDLVDRCLAEEAAAEERSRLEDRAPHPQPTRASVGRSRYAMEHRGTMAGMTTTLPLTDMPVPIVARPEGGYRVAGTRVSLESVVLAVRDGADACEIHNRFPTVDVPVAQAVIAYYLANRDRVDAYVEESLAEDERTYQEHVAAHPEMRQEVLLQRIRERCSRSSQTKTSTFES